MDATTSAASTHGAKILIAPKTYEGRGRQAVFADPQGAVFAVMASVTGDPPDADFYHATIGYLLDALPPDQGLRQMVMESGGYARATINEIPHDGSAMHSRWINFVRVEDAVDTVARADALGARTLVSPHTDRHGGRIAVLADPDGAWFGVMEWPDGNRPKAAK